MNDRSLVALGDAHNFGRRVERASGRIFKPRTLVWEWLLLSADSPLRRLLDREAKHDAMGPDAFAFLLDLKFSAHEARDGGHVESVELASLEDLSADEREELAGVVGRALALFSWLGLADLHWENLVLGRDRRNRIVFSPLDVEMILADLSFPTETKLLPDADPEVAHMCRHACGVRRVLPYLGKPVPPAYVVKIASQYLRMLAFLDRHSSSIAAAFEHVTALREAPIRVLLRGTDQYVRPERTTWPPLLDEERIQLERGDIPYFFRLYGRSGIHCYANEALTEIATLPDVGDVPQLEPLLSLARGLRSPTRRKLREEGLFTVLGAFDHATIRGRHESDGLAVTFRERTLAVHRPRADELETSRRMKRYVGSVYLPCCCGEVRTVFVPPVTRCDAGRSRT